jgi:hypothetical protein
MSEMSKIFNELEGYKNLEVSIIRATKIHRALNLILKLNNIPQEEVFQFKPRSRALLDYWNKLASEQRNNQPSPVRMIVDNVSASKRANGTSNRKGKRKLVNDENATDSVLGMAPAKKKSKNAVEVYLTVVDYCEITNFYQNKAHDNISSENLEIDLAVVPINAKKCFFGRYETVSSKPSFDSGLGLNGVRGSMGDGGTPKDAQRLKPMAAPKVEKMKTTRKVAG